MTIRKILVPIDFAGCAYDVVTTAAVLAGGLGAEVVLLYVVHLPSGVGAGTVVHLHGAPHARSAIELLRDDAREHIEPLEALFAAEGVRVHHAVRQGDVVEAILDAAEEEDADLIIMGTHGRRGLQRFFLGSVAEQVIRRAQVPVTTVRAHHPGDHAGADPVQLAVAGEADG
jgi:nucleotide-binding universal stress UspA family protein